MRAKPMLSLQDLPNIGPCIARLLKQAGIHSPEELASTGAVGAARRIRSIRPHDPPCRSMVCGLEGAISRVRWHVIPQAEREALWSEYESQL